MRNIITTFVYPPIPFRGCDWSAHFDGDSPDDNGQMLVGWGRTEEEAREELEIQYDELCERAEDESREDVTF